VAEGISPAALAAGVSEKFSAVNLARETIAGVMSSTSCKPFSSERDGMILGEGSAVLALEGDGEVSERGAVPLAKMTGYGEAFAYMSADSVPDSGSIIRAMQTALDDAGLAPGDIDVLIAHGDGTQGGDSKEIEAINEVFGGTEVDVYSSKGALGHMLAGSPAVDAALAVKMIQTGTVPPTLNSDSPDAEVKFKVVSGSALKKDIRRVMVNCTSREGHCASIIVETME
jgi:3-oxoacyl-(acyl-carrier-protein) synthase